MKKHTIRWADLDGFHIFSFDAPSPSLFFSIKFDLLLLCKDIYQIFEIEIEPHVSF